MLRVALERMTAVHDTFAPRAVEVIASHLFNLQIPSVYRLPIFQQRKKRFRQLRVARKARPNCLFRRLH